MNNDAVPFLETIGDDDLRTELLTDLNPPPLNFVVASHHKNIASRLIELHGRAGNDDCSFRLFALHHDADELTVDQKIIRVRELGPYVKRIGGPVNSDIGKIDPTGMRVNTSVA